MPLYEYQCKKCKHRFEKIQSFSAAPIKKCPQCGSAVEKLLSAPAVHFKGSGFYQTDYARKSAPETTASSDSKSDGKAAPPKSDGASGSSEAKASEQKSSESKSESKSEKSESKSSATSEPKGDPRGRSTHSKKSRKK